MWALNNLEFEYKETEFPCPNCGQNLLRVDQSRMLTCRNNDTETLFIVEA